MILQSLVKLYDALAEKGTLEKKGWMKTNVVWGLDINDDGQLLRILPLGEVIQRGKRIKRLGQDLMLPEGAQRSSRMCKSSFLWDNSGYILGYDTRSDKAFLAGKYEAAKRLHMELLEQVQDPMGKAVYRFFEKWIPEKAAEHDAVVPLIDEIESGNLTFIYNGALVALNDAIKAVWADYLCQEQNQGVRMQCLVTGEIGEISRLHPQFTKVVGAQPAGAALVSYNGTAFESFGKEKGLNAPVSTQAAFAYGAALNYLLSEQKHHIRMGDTTVVFWAENGEDGYSQFLCDLFDTGVTDQQLMDALKAIAEGRFACWKDMNLDPDSRFCILGLAPNAARLSVRFFLSGGFGELMRNVRRHQEDLRIAKPAKAVDESELSLYELLRETANQESRDKLPSPQMIGDLARAILQGMIYPATLYEQVQVRIRAERKITWRRAAIIKAYLTRQPNFMPKEVLTVHLNEDTNYQPYLLGRLFAVLEALQEKANPGINATIRDKYFSSASATPAIVFPTLIRLAQAHLKKLDAGWRIHFDKQLGEIISRMDASYPARLSLQDQGVFQLGYYHQTQKRFTKKEDVNNG
ncbi:MAG: type I-C CRISPR-associated protein Cas8c/Csd1 [Clostridia bacterium]|nr:type I-C CRISPR-associated protein Cas8c/Csd1 [Clostridia bacterium]